jgi:adenylate cyclase
MSSQLVVTEPRTNRSYDFELTRTETRIGRAPALSDLVLDSERVSRRHAVIRETPDGFVLTDLDSANGTLVNGQRAKQHTLKDKDSIAIGDYTLVFLQVAAAHPSIEYDTNPVGGTIVFRYPEQVALSAPGPHDVPVDELSARSLREDVDSLRKKAETLSRLYELSQLLRSVFSLEDIFKKLGEMIFRTTTADRFVVLLKDRATGELKPFATEFRDQDGAKGGDIKISRTVLDKVVNDRISLLSIDAQADERLSHAVSIVMQQVRSVMCAPLLAKNDVLGAIYVDCQQKMKIFTPDNLDMLNALAAQASMAVDNAMTHDQLVKEALARATYGRFMPRHVVEQILADPKALSLGGTNQVVTTLFSDVRGFTTLSERLRPEIVVELLNEYFSEMTPLVFDNGGLLDKYIGDGLMALFGVPYQSEQSAASAVASAIAMQRRMVALNKELQEKGLEEIAIGIGINTGTVTIGYIGSEQRTDYTVIGDAVNLAARLEKRAQPWQILISRSTLEAVGSMFTVNPVGEMTVKGRTEPVQVYEVVWQEGRKRTPASTTAS